MIWRRKSESLLLLRQEESQSPVFKRLEMNLEGGRSPTNGTNRNFSLCLINAGQFFRHVHSSFDALLKSSTGDDRDSNWGPWQMRTAAGLPGDQRVCPSLAVYKGELTRFAGKQNDDQVDSTTQALDHLRFRNALEVWAALGR